jgi:hypothetical protein
MLLQLMPGFEVLGNLNQNRNRRLFTTAKYPQMRLKGMYKP